jgi:hypothetical protein
MGMMIKDVELTEEQMRAIDGYKPIPVGKNFRYVPKAYKTLPSHIQPTFILRYVAGTKLMEEEDTLHGTTLIDKEGTKMSMQRGKFIVNICRHGIIGWENYFVGEEEVVYDKTLACLPQRLLSELCDAITERQSLDDAELLGLK